HSDASLSSRRRSARIVSQHSGAGDTLAHYRVPLLLVKRRRAQRISSPWQPGRLLIVLSQPRRPHQPQAVTSPRCLPPNLREVEPSFKARWQARDTLASSTICQRWNSIPMPPSQADDEVRTSSVNTMELETCWHIIEGLYFLLFLV